LCERLNSIGLKTSLTLKNFIRAANGFVSKIEYHEDLKAFSFPKCGTAPAHIVADGKSDGPTSRKVQLLKEFGHEEDDADCLPQGSTYKDRLFLPAYDERQSLCHLLSNLFIPFNLISKNDFCMTDRHGILGEHASVPRGRFVPDCGRICGIH
jgi:hypothetical protein